MFREKICFYHIKAICFSNNRAVQLSKYTRGKAQELNRVDTAVNKPQINMTKTSNLQNQILYFSLV
jgi:hypothetical protein